MCACRPCTQLRTWAYWRMCGWMKPVMPKSRYTCAASSAWRAEAGQQARKAGFKGQQPVAPSFWAIKACGQHRQGLSGVLTVGGRTSLPPSGPSFLSRLPGWGSLHSTPSCQLAFSPSPLGLAAPWCSLPCADRADVGSFRTAEDAQPVSQSSAVSSHEQAGHPSHSTAGAGQDLW